MSAQDPIDLAKAQVERLTEADPGAHTVMRGLEKKNGEYTGKECVVVLVEEKKPESELRYMLPRALVVGGNGERETVRVDVQEAPAFKIQILKLGQEPSLYAANRHQSCFSPTVPGGAQISPAGANWVGTLGVPWRWNDSEGKERFGFVTNRHVAGLENEPGHAMHQPNPSSKAIGRLVWSKPLNTTDPNQLDLSLFDSFLNSRHFVKPEVFSLRRIIGGVAALVLGDRVTKSGRTTGVTLGTVVGLDARTTVDYGERGALKFSQQVVIEGDGGQDASAAGDSGSGWFKVDGGFGALLFAGGGGKTLANPANLVVEAIGGSPFIV